MCTALLFEKHICLEHELLTHDLQASQEKIIMRLNHRYPVIPIIINGIVQLVQWGNRTNQTMPKTAYCRLESIQAGKWQWLRPQKVEIAVCAGFSKGVWFQVRHGLWGILVYDSKNIPYCYLLMRPSTHYYTIMTGAHRMPLLINQEL